jgi:hypothetical protein
MRELEGDEVVPLPAKPIGPRATAAWLSARGLYVPPTLAWEVSILINTSPLKPAAQLHVALDGLEWGFMFAFEKRMSWIRVGNTPTVHEWDDFDLLAITPPLRNLGTLVQTIEDRFELRFRRADAKIETNIPNADDKIRVWTVASL